MRVACQEPRELAGRQSESDELQRTALTLPALVASIVYLTFLAVSPPFRELFRTLECCWRK